jgi:hypothetical protein
VTADTTTTSSQGSNDDQFTQGTDRIRDTAKWLVTGFGALGSALIASLQLSNLAQVTGHNRTWALIGFGAAIAGVLIALLAAASVLVAVRVSFAEIEKQGHLRDYFLKNKELLVGVML